MPETATRPLKPACSVQRGDGVAAPVVFASPHSGAFYPAVFEVSLAVPLIDLRRTEDAFIDELFSCVPGKNLALVAANYGRCYVDVNRDARELDGDMFAERLPREDNVISARVRAGLGCLPRVGASGRNIYRDLLHPDEGAFRLDHVHEGYHDTLESEFERLQQDWSDVVLIDCHSMPSVQPGRSRLPDIVLGDRFGSSCNGGLTTNVEQSFQRLGLSVARNAPYAGGYTTRRYGRPSRGLHVLQIEINRSLYLNEMRVEKFKGFDALQEILGDVVDDIAAYALHLNA